MSSGSAEKGQPLVDPEEVARRQARRLTTAELTALDAAIPHHAHGDPDAEFDAVVDVVEQILHDRLRPIRKAAYSSEAVRYRNEAIQHAVAQPYADNRYVRLLDAIREALR